MSSTRTGHSPSTEYSGIVNPSTPVVESAPRAPAGAGQVVVETALRAPAGAGNIVERCRRSD